MTPTAGQVTPAVGRAVAELGAAVREGRDGTEVLGRVCAHARALAGAHAVTALAVDREGGFVVRAVSGRAAAWRDGTRVPAVDTLAWTAVRGREPVTAELRRCRYRHERALASGGLRRVLYLPLPRYGPVTGVLGAGYRGGGAVATGQLRALEAMAVVAALVPATDEPDHAPGAEEDATVDEREWLARELHDSVGQTLYGIGLGAGTAGALLDRDPAEARQRIGWIQETALAGLSDLRGLILRLRPEALSGRSLTAALLRLLDTTRSLRGYRATAEVGPEPSTSAEVQYALYRIAEEAVQNAARHAEAGHLTLRMHGHGSTVVLEVIDDGRGFVPGAEPPGRLGIRSMQERARAAGGRLEIVSSPGAGTRVRATLPAAG